MFLLPSPLEPPPVPVRSLSSSEDEMFSSDSSSFSDAAELSDDDSSNALGL